MSRIAKRRARIWNETICPAIEAVCLVLGTIIGGIALYIWIVSLILIFG